MDLVFGGVMLDHVVCEGRIQIIDAWHVGWMRTCNCCFVRWMVGGQSALLIYRSFRTALCGVGYVPS